MQHEPSIAVVVYDPAFADAEKLALAGFLAGYRGSTRDAYALDLHQFVSWCANHRLATGSIPDSAQRLRGPSWTVESVVPEPRERPP
jgi:hypothetical protein